MGGPHPLIQWKHEQAIKMPLDERPWYYQDKIRDFLHDAYNIIVDQSTIYRTLARMTITRKKLKITAAQRNPELRTQWQDNLQFFLADQIFCVDESGSDGRTGNK